MSRLTYWSLILSVAFIGGSLISVLKLNESFSKGFMYFLIMFYIPILAIIRMHSLGMRPIEMLQSVFNKKLILRRLFGKNVEGTKSS